jgi:hypothetical protein
MDFPRAQETLFSELQTQPWMAETDMLAMLRRIDGDLQHTAGSTRFDITKQGVALELTVSPSYVRVAGKVEPGVMDLFVEEDRPEIQALTPDGPALSQVFDVALARNVTVLSGGGYKPCFQILAPNAVTLAVVLKYVLKTEC